MASKCDFGISWAKGLGITLAKEQEVLVPKLHVRFRRGWGNKGEQGSVREIGSGMFAIYRMIAPQGWTCLFLQVCGGLVWPLFVYLAFVHCTNSVKVMPDLWQNPSLRASLVLKERRVTCHMKRLSLSGGLHAFGGMHY